MSTFSSFLPWVQKHPINSEVVQLPTPLDRHLAAAAEGDDAHDCQKLYEWTIMNTTQEVINGTTYYPFVLDGIVGTFTLPVYDNQELSGTPVARLRGNMITDPTGTDFTADASMYFYRSKSHLGVHVSYTYNPEDDFVYGYTVGGTGRYQNYNAKVSSVVVATEPKFIVEWTFCSTTALF